MLKDGTYSLVSRDINCNQTGQTNTFIRMLKTDPNHCALYWLTRYHPVVRSKACGNVTIEGQRLRAVSGKGKERKHGN